MSPKYYLQFVSHKRVESEGEISSEAPRVRHLAALILLFIVTVTLAQHQQRGQRVEAQRVVIRPVNRSGVEREGREMTLAEYCLDGVVVQLLAFCGLAAEGAQLTGQVIAVQDQLLRVELDAAR